MPPTLFFFFKDFDRTKSSRILLESQIVSLYSSICHFFNEPKKIRNQFLAYKERIVIQWHFFNSSGLEELFCSMHMWRSYIFYNTCLRLNWQISELSHIPESSRESAWERVSSGLKAQRGLGRPDNLEPRSKGGQWEMYWMPVTRD